VVVLLILLAASGVATAPRKRVTPLPLWPCSVVGRGTLPRAGRYLHARLEGQRAEHLVTVAGRRLTAYTWREGSFRQVAQVRLAAAPEQVTAGDVGGGGRDEVYAVSPSGAILTVRLVNGRLMVTSSPRLIRKWPVESVCVSDVRRAGRFELLIAANSHPESEEPGLPAVDVLLAYRRANGRWVRTWQAPFEAGQTGMMLMAVDTPSPHDRALAVGEGGVRRRG
jgi:hypothetical protein